MFYNQAQPKGTHLDSMINHLKSLTLVRALVRITPSTFKDAEYETRLSD